jgi:hypothetical protein
MNNQLVCSLPGAPGGIAKRDDCSPPNPEISSLALAVLASSLASASTAQSTQNTATSTASQTPSSSSLPSTTSSTVSAPIASIVRTGCEDPPASATSMPLDTPWVRKSIEEFCSEPIAVQNWTDFKSRSFDYDNSTGLIRVFPYDEPGSICSGGTFPRVVESQNCTLNFGELVSCKYHL